MDSGFRRNDEGATGMTKVACTAPPNEPYKLDQPNEFHKPKELSDGTESSV